VFRMVLTKNSINRLVFMARRNVFPVRYKLNFYVGFEVFTAVIMKSLIFWDMRPCSPLSFNRNSFFEGLIIINELTCP
jgi:hypothetical protein